jgi:hypothetical protein
MTTDELARLLSEHGHEIAWEQRHEFVRETARQEAERAERQKRKAKPGSGTAPSTAHPGKRPGQAAPSLSRPGRGRALASPRENDVRGRATPTRQES